MRTRNDKEAKNARRERAAERAAVRASRTDEEQIFLMSIRPGNSHREYLRLASRLSDSK